MLHLFLVLFVLCSAAAVAKPAISGVKHNSYVLGDSDTAIGMIHFEDLDVNGTKYSLSINFSELPFRLGFNLCNSRFDVRAACSASVWIIKTEPNEPGLMSLSVFTEFKKQSFKQFKGEFGDLTMPMTNFKELSFELRTIPHLRPKLKAELTPKIPSLTWLADSVFQNEKEPNVSAVIYE